MPVTSIARVEGQQITIDNRTYQADPEAVKRLVREELRVAHAEYGQPVSAGLNALVELMQAPEVKDAAMTFRVVFQAACAQIDVIAKLGAGNAVYRRNRAPNSGTGAFQRDLAFYRQLD